MILLSLASFPRDGGFSRENPPCHFIHEDYFRYL